MLEKKRFIEKGQLKYILPSNGISDSSKFKTPLIILLIINFSDFPPPITGWKTSPIDTDTSIAAFVMRARSFRNEIVHTPTSEMTKKTFESKVNEMRNILIGLQYGNMEGFEKVIELSNSKLFADSINHAF